MRVNFVPLVQRRTEKQYSKVLTKAGRIVSRKNTPRSKIDSLLKKLKQNLSDLEKDEVREKLKREISTELEAGGIPAGMIDKTTMVFVSLLIRGVELGSAEPSESIILYLKCGSAWSLVGLKDMVLSGLLARLLSDDIEEFIQSRPGIQLVVKAEDYNLCLSYLGSVVGKSVSRVLFARFLSLVNKLECSLNKMF